MNPARTHTDVFEKALVYERARQAREAGFYPYFLPLQSNEGAEAIYQGRRILMFGSNNYLGLTTHPKVREAAMKAIAEMGTSCTGSRFLNGTLEMHLELERRLAEFIGKEAALVFSTGMQTNLGTISAILGRGDTVFLDKDDHASIVDAARLGFGRIKRFRHNDLEDLERQLQDTPDDQGRLVVVDGLYSMEGDLVPLPELLEVSRRYGARVMVDDAHGVGVMGGGKGTAAHFDVVDETDLIMSTFSKSFASLGGFVAGDDQIIDYIQHHARALIFSASIPPPNAAAALAALEIMSTEPERVERLQRNGDRWRSGLQQLGFDTGNSVSPIVPVIVGDDMVTFGMWRMLLDEGVYTNPVVSPATPPGRQLLRTSCMATHTDEQIDEALEAFGKIGRLANLI